MRILALLLLVLAAAAQESPYLRELRLGHDLLQAGDPEEAVSHFARARQMEPANWRSYAWECVAHFMRAHSADPQRRAEIIREADAVATQLQKNVRPGFTDPLYLYLRGVIQAFQDNLTKAYTTLKKGANAAPERFERYAEFALRDKLTHACALQALAVGSAALRSNQFDQADVFLAEAEEALKDTSDEERLQRQRAVVCEHLERYDEAIARLRRVIEVTKSTEVRHELIGNIATIRFQQNRLEDARKVLAEAPADSKHPELVAARAMYYYKQALANPEGKAMDEGLAYYRKLLESSFPTISYRLAEQYTAMVLAKVRPQDAAKEAPLLKLAVTFAQREQEIRPECPSLYFALQRLHKLLGNAELELHYERIHKVKKTEFETRPPYDHTGRPRCR